MFGARNLVSLSGFIFCDIATLGNCVGSNTDTAKAAHASLSVDTVSEWLRRWTRNPLGSARRGSNPLGVGFFGVDDMKHKTSQCMTKLQ